MYKIYQVEYGDTIDLIARKNNTTSDNIKQINDLNNDTDLVVGSLIIVPKTSDQAFQTYKVKKGDSIYSISQLYGVNPDTLYLLNGLNKNEFIYPNQEILVPNKNIGVYVTKDGDTIDSIVTNLGIDANALNRDNKRIFVLPDQLIVSKKEENI